MNVRVWGIAIAAVVLGGAEASAMLCGRPGALGVSRVISVDPRVTPVVGGQDYGVRLPLAPGEVVLTFDDGPNPSSTNQVLKALADECLRATFFMVGRQARAHPQTVRQVEATGHTIGTHTQNHPLGRLHGSRATYEIDAGIASVTAALGHPPAPFFRFPGLYRTRESEHYLHQRGIVVWSVDVDSYDWKHNNTNVMLQSAVARLAARGGGILLMHDIKPRTAQVLPRLLVMLKARGLRVVHVVPRGTYPAGLIAMSQRRHSPNVDITAAPAMTTVRAGSSHVAEKSSFDSIFSLRAWR